MPTVLDDIVAGVREDLADARSVVSREQVEQLARQAAPALDAEAALRRPGLALIAEVKRASPSKGALAPIAGASVIGVNARNLKTLAVDPDTFARLTPLIPDSCVKVAESGVGGPDDAARFAGEGADAVLVGEALVRGSDPRRAAYELIAAGA